MLLHSPLAPPAILAQALGGLILTVIVPPNPSWTSSGVIEGESRTLDSWEMDDEAHSLSRDMTLYNRGQRNMHYGAEVCRVLTVRPTQA